MDFCFGKPTVSPRLLRRGENMSYISTLKMPCFCLLWDTDNRYQVWGFIVQRIYPGGMVCLWRDPTGATLWLQIGPEGAALAYWSGELEEVAPGWRTAGRWLMLSRGVRVQCLHSASLAGCHMRLTIHPPLFSWSLTDGWQKDGIKTPAALMFFRVVPVKAWVGFGTKVLHCFLSCPLLHFFMHPPTYLELK